MKISIVLAGVLVACGLTFAVENGPLLTALQPSSDVYAEVPVEEIGEGAVRPKRGLLLGAGLLGAGLIGAKIGLGAGVLAAPWVGGRGYGGYYGHRAYYGGGYYGGGFYGGGYYGRGYGGYGYFW